MPIYEYICRNCGLKKSFQHSYDEKIESCPECGAIEEFGKVLSGFATVIKKSNSVKVGNLTRQYIDENRELLEQEKKKLKNKNYE